MTSRARGQRDTSALPLEPDVARWRRRRRRRQLGSLLLRLWRWKEPAPAAARAEGDPPPQVTFGFKEGRGPRARLRRAGLDEAAGG